YIYVGTNCASDPDVQHSAWRDTVVSTASSCKAPASGTITFTSQSTVYAEVLPADGTEPVGYYYKVIDASTVNGDLEAIADTLSVASANYSASNDFIVSGLQCEKSYYLYVAAKCGDDNNSSWMRVNGNDANKGLFTMPICCIDPVGLSVSNPTSSSLSLQWQSGRYGGETQWEITYLYGPEIDSADIVRRVVVGQRDYTLTDLLPNTTYRIYLRSVCGDGLYSNYAPMVTARTLDTTTRFTDYYWERNWHDTYPGAIDPVNRVINMGYNSYDGVNGFWTDYNIASIAPRFSFAHTGTTCKVGSVQQVSSSTAIAVKDMGYKVVYHVFAEDKNIMRDWTVYFNAYCDEPVSVSVSSPSGSSVKIDWQRVYREWQADSTSPARYDIIVTPTRLTTDYDRENYNNIIHATTATGINTRREGTTTYLDYTVTGLNRNTTYWVYVRQHCVDCEPLQTCDNYSGWTENSITTQQTVPPCPDLENFSVQLTGDGQHTGAAMWNRVQHDNISGYDIIISDTEVSDFESWIGNYTGDAISGNSIDFNSLASGTDYYIYGRARCLNNIDVITSTSFSAHWSEGTFHTYSACRAPEQLTSAPSSRTTTVIDWVATTTLDEAERDSNYAYILRSAEQGVLSDVELSGINSLAAVEAVDAVAYATDIHATNATLSS
ncbi:MAG: fibronectin type III domain-containing protein, partial [Bacteroidales bacterium]|nr:fibronectin type III domain-containing protein [Candidatus Colimorpha onthohippi]